MTENQKFALELLGYLPAGYVLVCELMNHRACDLWGRAGAICVNGRTVYIFKI